MDSQPKEKRVYGEWFPELMLKRAQRDKVTVKPCIIEYERYKVKGYFYLDDYGQVWTYHLRRDGKVERSWVPTPVARVEEVKEEAMGAENG